MGHEIGVRESLYAFCFILIREDLQNCDEHIALIEMKSALFGVCVLSSISFSASEMKTFFSQMWVFFSVLIPGQYKFIWG